MSEDLPARRFGRVAAAMVTPFGEDGSLDLEAAARLARHLVDQGCDALVISGTTGEAPTTRQSEKDDLLRAVKDAVGERATIVAGAGSNDTEVAVRMATSAERCGADGLLVVAPYYNRPTQAGLVAHVRAVESATDLPILLYDIPGRTGLAFADATLDTLAHDPRVVAVKDATGDVERGEVRMERTGLEYYSGDDALNFSWLVHGASGVISVVAHVAASSYRRMVGLVDGQRVREARALSARLRPLVRALMGGGQGAVMAKCALYLQGVIPSAAVRLPLLPPPADEVDRLREALDSYALL